VRKLIVCGAGVVAALVLVVPGAFGGPSETGITPKTITIGATLPLTGTAAPYAPIVLGLQTYVKYVNARRGPDRKRGIMGRQVIYKIYDDGYNPANTVQLTRRLVEQDKVFAVVGQLGTEPVQSVRAYLNGQKVPQALVATGASYWGTQYKEFPWTIGFQPDYIAEGRLYGLHIRANQGGKKIAVLYQNDDYGKDYLYGLRAALGKSYADANVVAEEAVTATSTSGASQMARIRASGAQVLVIFGLPGLTITTYATGKALGFNPDQIYVNSVSANATFMNVASQRAGADYVNGSISITYLKDPSNPAENKDPAIQEYRRIMAKYAPSANASNQLYVYGFALAETFVQAMYKAGKNPTRQGLMNALTSLDTTNRFALNGIRLKTSKTDHFVISQMRLRRFNNGVWTSIGPLVEGRPGGS
jgi:branched-chain amino acid transport system substrate-binding protein